MKIKLPLLVALVTLGASSVAFAAPKEFKPADANGDGIIDKAEYADSGMTDKSFADVDLNKDGKISKSEYEEALADCG